MIKPEISEDYADLSRAFEHWQLDPLNYFQHSVNNAHTESLNNLIKVMSRSGRGYWFEALCAKTRFFEGMCQYKYKNPLLIYHLA